MCPFSTACSATLTKTLGYITHFPNWIPCDKAAIFKRKAKVDLTNSV